MVEIGIMSEVPQPDLVSADSRELPRLLDPVRAKKRLLHMSMRGEEAHVQRIERFLRFDRERTIGTNCY